MGCRFCNIEANYILAANTLLDPRFKKLEFGDPSACSQAIEQLKAEVVSTTVKETLLNQGVPLAEQQQTADHHSELWSFIDDSVASTNSCPSSPSSVIMFHSYMDESSQQVERRTI